jgi:capsular exopolysaccharide synthesis family protein
MSRNFELLQQMGRAQEFPPIHAAVEEQGAGEREVEKSGRNGRCLDFSQFAHEESLRLVQRTFLLPAENPPRAVVFAGIDHGNGCSHLCAQLAETLASNTGGSTCLVDANLRSPSLPELFGTTNHFGLTDALRQAGPIRSFVKPLRVRNVSLLSCGSIAADAPSLLNSDRLKDRFVELRKEFDYVVVDAPPLTRYADAVTLGQVTDGFVLVLEANATRREAALVVAENLRAAHIRILGAVLNKRTFPIPNSLYKKL